MNRISPLILLTLFVFAPATETRAVDVMHTERFTVADGLSHRIVSSIEQDSAGVIWMATWNGICRWDSAGGFQTVNQTADGQKIGRLLLVMPVPGGKLWCLWQNRNQAALFDPGTLEMTPAGDIPYRRGGTRPYILSLDSTGLLISRQASAGRTRGPSPSLLFQYFIPYPEGHHADPDNRIVALLDREGRLWINWDDALWRITFTPAVFTHETHISGPISPSFGNEIRAIRCTSGGDLLLASKNDRLYLYRPSGEFLGQVSAPKIYNILDDGNNLWLASKGQGLFRGRLQGDSIAITRCRMSVAEGTAPLLLYDLFIQDSTLWCASWGQGLFRAPLPAPGCDEVTLTHCPLSPEEKLRIRRLVPLPDKRIAVCAASGLFLYNPATGTTSRAGSEDVSDLCSLNDTLTLVSTMGTGLWRLTSDTTLVPFQMDSLPDLILSMCRRGEEVWFACDNALVTWRPSYRPRLLDSRFWGEMLNFSEASPALTPRGEMQFATTRGHLILQPDLLPPLQPQDVPTDGAAAPVGWILAFAFVVASGTLLLVAGQRSKVKGAQPRTDLRPLTLDPSLLPSLQGRAGERLNDSPFRTRLLALIEARYHESGLNTDIMAQEMAMSRTALFERVRMEFDTTPAALLLSARIAHATEMLKSGDRPVGEIAVLCGFSDAKYFSKVYKKQTGKSPSLLLPPPTV